MAKVFIEVMGGVVTNVYAGPGIEAFLIDYDDEERDKRVNPQIPTESLALIEQEDEPSKLSTLAREFRARERNYRNRAEILESWVDRDEAALLADTWADAAADLENHA